MMIDPVRKGQPQQKDCTLHMVLSKTFEVLTYAAKSSLIVTFSSINLLLINTCL